MKLLTTPAVRPGRCFVVDDGVLVVDDGDIADLVRVDGDDAGTEIYVHPIDAPAFSARWFECGESKGG
ncbi:hypothetical protein BF49_2545 [Bradyrhizobium sp.]|uniref:hypothetical protein n=1 Tax=Bradyrhizobium sp. TaxID=376 RepID=UPI0007C17F07|nr:hypothetical protein [Bradyrhizobium sp.]CUT11465.1 hypothetical protein BF49_2545 [Bradyrhizobium sp.]